MIQAYATRMPSRFSWVWLSIVAVSLTPASLSAQVAPPPKDGTNPPAGTLKPDDAPPAQGEEVFVDPNAKKALTVFNPLTFVGPPIKVGTSGDDRSKVQSMAGRATNLDPDFLKRYIEWFTVELTRRDNLNAILNPPPSLKPSDQAARGVERAVDGLTKPIIDARANDNREFLVTYERLLFESKLPRLLEPDHNYLSRLDAMIVLGMAGNPTPVSLDLFIAQLKKPDQLVWVKLWAARGLSIAARGGEVDLDASRANQATEALLTLLESDPKLPWPVQMRVLEALGSIRVSTANTSRSKIDSAPVILKFLVDSEARLVVRAWAAWALGFIKAPSSGTTYNFSLGGHEIGELASDLASQIVEEYDDDPVNFDKEKDQATHLTSLLLFQICPSLIGQEGVRDSGLLQNRAAADARPFLTKLDDKVKAVSRQAYELMRAAGAGNKAARDDLDAKLADLKTFLAASKPKDRRFIPGGPEIPAHPAREVAGAPGP